MRGHLHSTMSDVSSSPPSLWSCRGEDTERSKLTARGEIGGQFRRSFGSDREAGSDGTLRTLIDQPTAPFDVRRTGRQGSQLAANLLELAKHFRRIHDLSNVSYLS